MTIDFDFTPYFDRYEALVAKVDQIFEKVRADHPDCVRCELGCADCCHALFDLSFIEAVYLNHRFREGFDGRPRQKLIEKANRADRSTYKIKRKAHKDLQEGKDEAQILSEIGAERVRCPLLNEKEQCDLYRFRPITCRLYGIPTSINGIGHTCGLSGFQEGTAYPTANLDLIHRELRQISTDLVSALNSKYVRLVDLLVPVSMAMLTLYDEEYLGVAPEPPAGPDAAAKGRKE
jgi:Fe-S-cluster containining protein